MNAKLITLIVFTLVTAYRLFLLYLDYRSAGNPTPDNVKDVYDAETYEKWVKYHAEKCRLGLVQQCVSYIVLFVLILTNAFSAVCKVFGENVYAQAIAVLLFDQIVEMAFGVWIEYRDAMVIDEKYGFNRMTKKTFIADQIKSFVIGMVIAIGIVALLIAVHSWLGDGMAILFAALLFVFILGFSFLYPVFSRVFNRFTPLEEGALKDQLTKLLTDNGYQVRAIKVMDASRRTTKSNAYFTGFGRMKTIVLYDTLVNSSTPEEICAVFAHEMGHGIHKDTLKNQILSFVNVCLMAVAVWLTVRTPAIFTDFGFDKVNYGFAFILLGNVELALISPLFGLVVNAFSRRAEYRADRQAVKEGYGEALISSLKKLTRENFGSLAPSKLLVKLEYSHPTLSQRVTAIENAMKEEGK